MTYMDYAHNDGASRSVNRLNSCSIMHRTDGAPWTIAAETYEQFVFTVFTFHVTTEALDSATQIWGERNDTLQEVIHATNPWSPDAQDIRVQLEYLTEYCGRLASLRWNTR